MVYQHKKDDLNLGRVINEQVFYTLFNSITLLLNILLVSNSEVIRCKMELFQLIFQITQGLKFR